MAEVVSAVAPAGPYPLRRGDGRTDGRTVRSETRGHDPDGQRRPGAAATGPPAVRPGTVAGLTEGQLLDRFVAGRDEAAFEALVARHGPMVLGVCRRVLARPARRRGRLPGHLPRPGPQGRLDPRAATRSAPGSTGSPAGSPLRARAVAAPAATPASGPTSDARPRPATDAPAPRAAAVLDEELDRLPGEVPRRRSCSATSRA